MARRSKADWDALVAEYAKAYQDTSIKAQDWYESVIDDGLWGSAKRYITTKNAKAFIAGSYVNSSEVKTANNRKAETKNRKASKQTANNRKSKSDGETSTKAKSLKNKDKKGSNSTTTKKKTEVKSDTVTANNEAETATAKQPHEALIANTANNCESDSSETPFIEGEMCGARTRFGTRCKKQAGWGTTNFGAGRCRLHGGHKSGAPLRNTNATVHGIYSQYLDEDELALFHSHSAVEMDLSPEIARVRIELKRCYERAAMQRDLLGGSQGYFQWNKADTGKELDTYEEGSGAPSEDNPEGNPINLSKFIVRDYGAIADKLMGRLLSLMRQQTQLATFVPRDEGLELLDFYLSEYETGVITAKQVALSLAKFGIKVPSVIDIALRAEIDVQGSGDSVGLSDAELDAMVEQERAEAEANFAANMEGREDIVARMMAGENIDLEAL